MWGLYQTTNVPTTPDPVLLKDFYFKFSSPGEVETVVENDASPNVIPMHSIMSMQEVRTSGGRIANSLGHINQIHILYCQGIWAWGPDLNNASDSLYNSACRITCLKSFRELLSSGAYNYMNPSKEYINALPLFIRYDNHFVHYLMTDKFKAKTKNAGILAKQNSRKVMQKNRESGFFFPSFHIRDWPISTVLMYVASWQLKRVSAPSPG